MSGHTPGPWTAHFCEDGTTPNWVTAEGAPAAIAEVSYLQSEGNANACLIAAAPELLEAAKGVIERDADRPSHFGDVDAPGHAHSKPGIWDDDNGALAGKPCQWCKAWTSLRAAIAKAEGR